MTTDEHYLSDLYHSSYPQYKNESSRSLQIAQLQVLLSTQTFEFDSIDDTLG